ncbi:serine/threonine-protein kinase [Nonomuraea cavernae]|uniref:Protein kinase domain-containing protein n=1 Tax=Nonomuraea cavernae TaxID=2045107 RepID=A0A917Z850_9ACTN|nr:serine/threonine-protein kinase [Nonomuraea cavernae]MCA2188926.1 protein kinase [Nonomuraea cavernae]GGO75521.1 hypothetical protein GCM10012289_50790 [Nonomuraea cavernae]
MSDEAPSLVAGRYRLDELIGSGPMGEVWRAYDTRADWTVAVKLLGPQAVGAATREALQRHAQAVAKVIHPNVAMVLDVGDRDGAPFLVLEFLTGESLGEELAARGPLRIVDVCDLVGQAAAGLDAAHRAGVVHGQVGPDSFRRAGSGVLKVVGFGLADQPPAPDAVRYRAPELADGRSVSASADLYALGCVCYELLCGRSPFENTGEKPAGPHAPDRPTGPSTPTGPSAPIGQGAAGEPGGPLPPSRHRPEIPAELDRLVLAMLSRDPAGRPAGGEAVRRALATIARPRPQATPLPAQGMAATFPTGAPRAGDTAIFEALPGAERTSNRKLFVQLGVAVAVIVAVTVGMMAWGGSGRAPVSAPATSAPASTAPSAEPATTAPPTSAPSEPAPTATPGEVVTLRETGAPNPKATLRDTVPPGGWPKWLSEFDKAVTAQETIGGIEPRTARKAHDKIRKSARKFAEGREESGRGELRDIVRDLARAQEKGDVDTAGPLADFLNDWRL